MSLEIKTAAIEPVRKSYANIIRRFGEKPATRYQEATYDAQGTTNFHYRPLWKPEKELNDKNHTVISMEDWYAFRDPRQFYYGTYVQNRARMQEGAEQNYSFFEKRELIRFLPEAAREKIILTLLPLRHVEQTANLNHLSGTAYGYGTAITQASLYAGMDRLGMAQYLSRIGLILDGNSGSSLSEAKKAWMDHPAWQKMRALCEEMLVQEDWFELLLVQNLLVDTYIQQVIYAPLEQDLLSNEGRDVAMLTEFMQVCLKDIANWSDAIFKVAAGESEHNKEQMLQWIAHWSPKVEAAFLPVVELVSATQSQAAMQGAKDDLARRQKKIGLL